MATVLAAATVFPIPPDGGTNAKLARAWMTNVISTESGDEGRSALRALPVRRLEYSAVFGNASELGQFRAAWIGAAERLRFIVPVWPRAATPTAFPDASTISGDFTNRGFVAGNVAAMLWLSENSYELVDVETVADGEITLSNPVVGTYAVSANGPTLLIPTMRAWLEPPTVDQLSSDVERVPLAFTEELPGIAGIDPSIGGAETPVVDRLEEWPIHKSSQWGPRKSGGHRIIAYDAADVPIPNPPLLWEVTPTGTHPDPGAEVTTFPNDGNEIHLAYTGNAFTGFVVTVTSGAATITFSDS